eukprot:sb/3472722/
MSLLRWEITVNLTICVKIKGGDNFKESDFIPNPTKQEYLHYVSIALCVSLPLAMLCDQLHKLIRVGNGPQGLNRAEQPLDTVRCESSHHMVRVWVVQKMSLVYYRLKSKFSRDGDLMGTLQPRRLLRVDLRIEKRSFRLMVAKLLFFLCSCSLYRDAGGVER